MSIKRTILSFPNGNHRFNYRVAGVALRRGHVLVCREDDDDYVMLPGGRVELGEPSAAALQRELREELRCNGRIDRLAYTVENFFHRKGEQFHELALYYVIDLPSDFPFVVGEPCRVTHDEGHVLSFDWVRVDTDTLQALNLLPVWIRGRLHGLPASAEHLMIDERAAVPERRVPD